MLTTWTYPQLCQAVRNSCKQVALQTDLIQVLQVLPAVLRQLLQLVAMQ